MRTPHPFRLIEPESTLCPCGCGEIAKIGEDRSERLDIVPAQLRVLVTVGPRYVCGACERGVVCRRIEVRVSGITELINVRRVVTGNTALRPGRVFGT